jgi:protoheme IX farnesyltransferase
VATTNPASVQDQLELSGTPAHVSSVPPAGVAARVSPFRDILALTKPRITFIVLATCASGMAMAPGRLPWTRALAALIGTTLIVASANTLNMWWERDLDRLMARTSLRPLPAGRMAPRTALAFGLLLAAVSLPLLAWVNLVTSALGLLALVIYVLVYTPMKRHSTLALLVGAVPGAMPPLMGWTSVTGSVTAAGPAPAMSSLPPAIQLGGVALFLLLFVWQVPHFIAISFFRANDYASAGMKVVPVERGERVAKWQILGYTLLLVGSSLGACGLAGTLYLVSASLFGAFFIALSAYGLREQSGNKWARSLFAYSIIYLVAILAIMIVDRTKTLL